MRMVFMFILGVVKALFNAALAVVLFTVALLVDSTPD